MRFSTGIQQYTARKHAEGIEFAKGEEYLRRPSKSVGDVELDEVNTQQITTFLNKSVAGAATWRLKYFVLRHFFDFWAAHGAAPDLPMPTIRPKERMDFLPYVYSRSELKALLKATTWNYEAKISVARPTIRALIVLLYRTGARIGEVLSLVADDINLQGSTILITNKNPNRCRQLPIGADLREVLRKYLPWRARQNPSTTQLFITKSGKPLSGRVTCRNFQRLREIAHVTRDPRAAYQPRLNDLQCTFAVHRITSWIRSGPDASCSCGLYGASRIEFDRAVSTPDTCAGQETPQ